MPRRPLSKKSASFLLAMRARAASRDPTEADMVSMTDDQRRVIDTLDHAAIAAIVSLIDEATNANPHR